MIELSVMLPMFRAKMNRKFNSSLIWRDPIMFLKKYVATFIRKPSFGIMKKLLSRQ